MSAELLDKSRKLSRFFKLSDAEKISNEKLLDLLSGLLDAEIYIISDNDDSLENNIANCELLDTIRDITSTRENFVDGSGHICLATPILAKSVKLGVICAISQKNRYFDVEDIVIAENAAVFLGMEMLSKKQAVSADNERKQSMAKAAMRTLSTTEAQAVVEVFEELNGADGLLVTSRIADRAGITRSVIINAMRKLESAGIIVCRSSGMKGTNIKVVNERIYEEVVLAKDRI